MRKGFTLVELIFVIVIIGILAAVAIPKLNATRTDAKISAIADEVRTGIDEVASYVTAKGGKLTDYNITDMSQVFAQMVAKGDANETNSTHLDIITDNNVKCVKLDTNATTLKVDVNESASQSDAPVCYGIAQLLTDANYTVAGTGVKY